MYFENNKQIKILHQLLHLLVCAPYTRTTLYQPIKSRIYWKLYVIVTLLCAVAALLKTIVVIHLYLTRNFKEFLSSFSVVVKFFAFFNHRICLTSRKRNDEVVYFANQVAKQESVLLNGREKKLSFFSILIRLPSLYLPLGFLVTLLKILKNPCSPPYFGYLLFVWNTEAEEQRVTKFLLILLGILFASSYLFVMASATIGLFLELLLGVKAFSSMLTVLSSSNLQATHSERRFWNLKNRLNLYQNLRILSGIYNNCFQSTTFLCALLGGYAIIVLNGIMLIRMSKAQPGAFIAHILLGSSATYSGVGYLLKVSSNVNTNSQLAFAMDLTLNKVLRKRISSSRPIQIKMGTSNYVDQLTCLVFGSNVVETIVSYALVSK